MEPLADIPHALVVKSDATETMAFGVADLARRQMGLCRALNHRDASHIDQQARCVKEAGGQRALAATMSI